METKEKMKAVVLYGPNDYRYTEVDKPQCDDAGILVRVKACGLCGSDLRTLRSGHRNVKLPAILGHEVSGMVVKTGRLYRGCYNIGDDVVVAPVVYCGECEHCKAGQFQFCENIRELAQDWQGGFAEYMAIPPEALQNGTVQLKPEALEYAHAAISEPPSSCINAQELLNIGIEDTVVIIGAGPVGCMHICVAKAKGAKKVFIADVSEDRLAFAQRFEPDAIINAAETNLVERVRELTDGKGAEVVITANPVAQTQVQAVEMAKKAGRIAFFGGLPHDNCTPNIDTNAIHYKGLHIIGTTTFSPKHNRLSLDLITRGKIPADKLITHKLPLASFEEGVALAVQGKALKVVFELE